MTNAWKLQVIFPSSFNQFNFRTILIISWQLHFLTNKKCPDPVHTGWGIPLGYWC